MQNKAQRRRVRQGLDCRMPAEDSELYQKFQENRETSPLLRLPPELRIRIYELVLSVGQISVDHASYRGGGHRIRCGAGPPAATGFYCRTLPADENPWDGVYGGDLGRPIPWRSGGVTLLSGVCRQMYHETVLMPYRLNTWSFYNTHVMGRYLRERRLPLRQRKAIHTLFVSGEFSKAMANRFGGLRVVVWDDPDRGGLRRQVLAEEPLVDDVR